MKKTVTFLATILIANFLRSQTHTESFESFTLSTNSAYTNTNSVPFQGTSSVFEYKWDAGFNFWSGGFSYTNKYDSATAGFGNLYGVKPLKGYNSSNTYVIGQDKGVIKLKSPYKGVEGMYLTNSTYAYKSMKLGDSFAKKFGGTSGNDPDFFKITIKGYSGGVLKTDSVEFYLADFRNSNNALDYIVDSWQWVNTMSLGQVDSIRFFMYSSDVGSFGINTPLFFGLDNFTTSPSFVGLNELNGAQNASIYPNPSNDKLFIQLNTKESSTIQLFDSKGKLVIEQLYEGSNTPIDLSNLTAGIYNVKINTSNGISTKKLIKN
ncbi:MAG: DUF4465 domain-containing protein [Sphingobacteriaceae bacterium]